MTGHHTINYLEIPTKDLAVTKAFFNTVFGWRFLDYGSEYSCFLDVGINGGFYQASQDFNLIKGSPLIVIYSQSLEQTLAQVLAAGGEIVRPIFQFPGGRRFHFNDPNRNEYAVWSE